MIAAFVSSLAANALHFVLSHAIWAIPLVLVAACLIVPGLPAALFAFARTTAGRIVIACLLAGAIGWEARAALDASWDRSERLRADLAAADARAALEAARAAENARQALAQRDIAASASARERTSAALADTLQEQVDDYASDLASQPPAPQPSSPHAAPSGCRLSDADARRLRGIGATKPRH